MKFFQRLSFLVLGISLVTGCTMNNGAREDVNDRDNNAEIQNYDNNGARVQNYDNDNNNVSNMRVADKAQDKITAMDEISSAYVIVTDQNAYVAVVTTDGTKGNVSKDLEQKVSDKVKSTDNNIQNVYVSSNPDFVDNMRDYGNQIQNGKPIRGLFDQFSDMVRRVFPSAR